MHDGKKRTSDNNNKNGDPIIHIQIYCGEVRLKKYVMRQITAIILKSIILYVK